MTDRCNVKEQIELYNSLIHNMAVVKKKTITNNGVKLSFVGCRDKNTELLCVRKTHVPHLHISISSPKYWAYITRNGKKEILYGTIPQLLYKQYANGQEPVIDLISIKTQGKTK